VISDEVFFNQYVGAAAQFAQIAISKSTITDASEKYLPHPG